MGKDSKIGWTDHTANAWQGCVKVDEGCKHCYAERHDKRWRRKALGDKGTHWGPKFPRLFRDPDRLAGELRSWNKAAEKAGKPARVFCGSLCDIFEDNRDAEGRVRMTVHANGQPAAVSIAGLRRMLFETVEVNPWLIYLFLTKRPENIFGLVPRGWIAEGGFPSNVMIGTSVSSNKTRSRIAGLIGATPFVPDDRRFLSCEPLLAPLGLTTGGMNLARRFGWVIAGGESGPKARPMKLGWVRRIRYDCASGYIPFFYKQAGGLRPGGEALLDGHEYKEFPGWHSERPVGVEAVQ